MGATGSTGATGATGATGVSGETGVSGDFRLARKATCVHGILGNAHTEVVNCILLTH